MKAFESSVSIRMRLRAHPVDPRIRCTRESTALSASSRLCGCARKLREARSIAVMTAMQRVFPLKKTGWGAARPSPAADP